MGGWGDAYVVVAELQEDIGVLLVLEEMVEFDNVPVVEGPVDADFGLELLVVWLRWVGGWVEL